jgi:hypothetical protein
MSNHSLIIADLPLLEEVAANHYKGGSAQASTATYTGPGVAVAVAQATASGEVALTNTRTNAVVKQTSKITISRAMAWATAVSFDGNNYSRDRSFSHSIYISPN